MNRREFIRVKSAKAATEKLRLFFYIDKEVWSLFRSRSTFADKNVPWMLWFCGEKNVLFEPFRNKKNRTLYVYGFWWRRWDSNSLPLQCECSALPDELRPQALIKYSRFFVVCQYRRKINLKRKRNFSWRCIRWLFFGAIHEFGFFLDKRFDCFKIVFSYCKKKVFSSGISF